MRPCPFPQIYHQLGQANDQLLMEQVEKEVKGRRDNDIISSPDSVRNTGYSYMFRGLTMHDVQSMLE